MLFRSQLDIGECARVKIYYKDRSRIPLERNYELDKKFYLLKVMVEPDTNNTTASEGSRRDDADTVVTRTLEMDGSSAANPKP